PWRRRGGTNGDGGGDSETGADAGGGETAIAGPNGSLRPEAARLARRLRKGSANLFRSPRHPSPAMPALPSAPVARRAPALPLLLARYIAGEVAEAQLFGLTDLFDAADV